jgi:hypothetical protein
MMKKSAASSNDVSVIQDIVKRKKITFLKSSNLFSQDQELFTKNKKATMREITTVANNKDEVR